MSVYRENARDDFILSSLPIWTHSSPPSEWHEVALFRHTFECPSAVQDVELLIFADTRYEAWLDGNWIGRGPARFSDTLREYDRYTLGSLHAGRHLIAVLVQWAPSLRRSESLSPFLIAHIGGQTPDGFKTLAVSSPAWKSLPGTAWRWDSSLVYAGGLVGPTELLDLRLLPQDWYQTDYSDDSWDTAVPAPVSLLSTTNAENQEIAVAYRPRSIPRLVEIPLKLKALDAGVISPGYLFGEIPSTATNPYPIEFSAEHAATLILKVGSSKPPEATAMTLDGKALVWQRQIDDRADIYKTVNRINAGTHRLTFEATSAGLAFCIWGQDIQLPTLPFNQGNHAGRRNLLAEFEPALDQVTLTVGEQGLVANFQKTPAYLILDMGRTVHGRLSAAVIGPAGAVIDIGWDERLSPFTHRPLPYPGSLHAPWNQVDSWILDGKLRTITTLDARAGRYILITTWGKGPIQLQDIKVLEEHYPTKQVGYFHSSQPAWDQIWQVGVDTLIPNMTDAYTDTPWRERGEWWGDAYVEEHINRVAFGDQDLIRRGILYLANQMAEGQLSPGLGVNNQNHQMLDYTMLWVHSLAEHLDLTGDLNTLQQVYPYLRQFMAYLENHTNLETGLLDLPKSHWSRTAYIDVRAWNSRFGQPTALNALYYDTLLKAADLAKYVNDVTLAQNWKEKAENVKRGVNKYLYIASERRYATTLFEGKLQPPGPHAQAWALVYGLVPEGEVEAVVEALLELISDDPTLPNVETYGMFWVLEALGKNGGIVPALKIIEQYYGYMLDAGATTWWEIFTAGQNWQNSLSHGWSGAPTWFLTTYVLGARQTGPHSWSLRPAFGYIDFVFGSLPIGDSTLQVSWEKQSCRGYRINIVSAEETEGELWLPFFDPSLILKADDQVIFKESSSFAEWVSIQDKEIFIRLEGGDHHITLEFTNQGCINTNSTAEP